MMVNYCTSNHLMPFLACKDFGRRAASNFVDLPIQFFHFFIPIYDVFIEIHEIVTQIMLMSDFRVIVHCHSIHLIHLLHFWLVNSSGTSDLVCILHFLSIFFFDSLCTLLIFTNNQTQRFELKVLRLNC